MAVPTTYTVTLPLKKFADSIIVAQALIWISLFARVKKQVYSNDNSKKEL